MQRSRLRGFLIVFLALFLSAVTVYRFHAKAASMVAVGSNFDIYLANSALVFQTAYRIEFDCVSGVWNGTNSTLSVSLEAGSLSFVAMDNCTLDIETVSDRTFQVTCSGATFTRTEGNYTVVIASGPRVTITWRFLPWSIIDNYFMLGVGIAGIAMLVAGPTWFARTYVSYGLDSETIEHLGYGMLLIIMGFGFVVVWLWPA